MFEFLKRKKVLAKEVNCNDCNNKHCECRQCQGLLGSCYNVLGTPCVFSGGYNCGGFINGTDVK